MTNVVIVDPHEIWRTGVRLTLEQDPDLTVVGQFEFGDAAISQATEIDAAIALVSVDLPDVSGFQVCLALLDADIKMRVIMIGSTLSDTEIFASMVAGAFGYLPKRASMEDVVRLVKANSRGEMVHVQAVAERVLRFTQYNRQFVNLNTLTEREYEISILLAAGRNDAEIGAELGLSVHTVRTHISHIFSKLNISRRGQLGVFAVLMGALAPREDETGQSPTD